jgi:hypothetical protein
MLRLLRRQWEWESSPAPAATATAVLTSLFASRRNGRAIASAAFHAEVVVVAAAAAV